MIKALFKAIEQYQTIIIHRHSRPDLDALGSQRGLALVLRHAYPKKEIYMVGDMSPRYAFLGSMDEIEDSKYDGALAIITDVAVKAMVSDDRYLLAKDIYVIDHHQNASDITSNVLCDPSKIAVSEWIAFLLMEQGFTIPKEAATALLGGIITDSGRFLYGETSATTFLVASELLKAGADKDFLYRHLYTETLSERKMKNYFASRFETTQEGVAYLKNDLDVFERFHVGFFDISRGMVSVMAGIEEIPIWCNFTKDPKTNAVVGEFRSREIPIVDIAKKYGGGGHALACGATLKDFDMADAVLEDFNELIRKTKVDR